MLEYWTYRAGGERMRPGAIERLRRARTGRARPDGGSVLLQGRPKAMGSIRRDLPELARQLDASLETGTHCVDRPQCEQVWKTS